MVFKVVLYDVAEEQVTKALKDIRAELLEFEAAGTLRGTLNAVDQGKLVSGTNSLADCVKGTLYIQVNLQGYLHISKIMYYVLYQTMYEINILER